MGTQTLEVPLSDDAKERLRRIAAQTQQSEAELAAALLEGALAADELESALIRQRLRQADAGGPFARYDEVLAWLEAVAEGQAAPPPKGTAAP